MSIRPNTQTADVVIVGAGHNGLAISHCLQQLGIEHVILERGQVANTWRTERWDSLKLLSPNWQCSLPGFRYEGMRPKDFMDVQELIGFIDDYAQYVGAPLYTETCVTSVVATEQGYRLASNRGEWRCRALVLASGAFNIPLVPGFAGEIPAFVDQLTPHSYRNPAQLAEGGVLLVGASATGLQLANEIQQSGREVTLCVGEHVRLPRNYRGQDIMWWMNMLGISDECHKDVDDLVRARHVASPQLIGSDDHSTLDLNVLQQRGVRLCGKLSTIRHGKALFSGALQNICKLADLKMNRLLASVDQWIEENPWEDFFTDEERPRDTQLRTAPRLELDFASGEIKTVIWACGFRPDYSWLQVPVLDHKGRLQHDGGVVAAPGLYAMGLPFMRKRKSSFIFGASDDARFISHHLAGYLNSIKLNQSVFVA